MEGMEDGEKKASPAVRPVSLPRTNKPLRNLQGSSSGSFRVMGSPASPRNSPSPRASASSPRLSGTHSSPRPMSIGPRPTITPSTSFGGSPQSARRKDPAPPGLPNNLFSSSSPTLSLSALEGTSSAPSCTSPKPNSPLSLSNVSSSPNLSPSPRKEREEKVFLRVKEWLEKGKARGGAGGGEGDEEFFSSAVSLSQQIFCQLTCLKSWTLKLMNKKLENNFQKQLKDGVLLCEIVNTLRPNTIQTIHVDKTGSLVCSDPFFQIENLTRADQSLQSFIKSPTNDTNNNHTRGMFEVWELWKEEKPLKFLAAFHGLVGILESEKCICSSISGELSGEKEKDLKEVVGWVVKDLVKEKEQREKEKFEEKKLKFKKEMEVYMEELLQARIHRSLNPLPLSSSTSAPLSSSPSTPTNDDTTQQQQQHRQPQQFGGDKKKKKDDDGKDKKKDKRPSFRSQPSLLLMRGKEGKEKEKKEKEKKKKESK